MGADVLTGGTGNDTFVFKFGDGNDIVTDFHTDDDLIDLIDHAIANFNVLLSLIEPSGVNDTLINLGGGDSITVQNVQPGALEQRHFLLGT